MAEWNLHPINETRLEEIERHVKILEDQQSLWHPEWWRQTFRSRFWRQNTVITIATVLLLIFAGLQYAKK